MPATSTAGIRSVDKALDILEVLARESQGLALSEIARRLQQNESTVHHLLATLRRRGLVDQDQQTKAYRFGYGLVDLVSGFLARVDLYSSSLGPMQELRDRSGESSYLTVLQDRLQVTVIEIIGWKPIQARRSHLSGQTCLHSTASGKLLLAYLPPEQAERLLSSLTLTKFTPYTITDLAQLRAEFAAIRRQGYALDREENYLRVMCVAAPVFDRHGTCVASASVAFVRAGEERLAELIPLVVDTAAVISRRLGYTGASQNGQLAAADALPNLALPRHRETLAE